MTNRRHRPPPRRQSGRRPAQRRATMHCSTGSSRCPPTLRAGARRRTPAAARPRRRSVPRCDRCVDRLCPVALGVHRTSSGRPVSRAEYKKHRRSSTCRRGTHGPRSTSGTTPSWPAAAAGAWRSRSTRAPGSATGSARSSAATRPRPSGRRASLDDLMKNRISIAPAGAPENCGTGVRDVPAPRLCRRRRLPVQAADLRRGRGRQAGGASSRAAGRMGLARTAELL